MGNTIPRLNLFTLRSEKSALWILLSTSASMHRLPASLPLGDDGIQLSSGFWTRMTGATETQSPTSLVLWIQPALQHMEPYRSFRWGLTHLTSSSIPNNVLLVIMTRKQFSTGNHDRCIPGMAKVALSEKLLHFRNHYCNFCHPFIFIEGVLLFKCGRSGVKVTEWSVQFV